MAFGDFTVARTSVKRVLNASGVLASVAANTPAFEFNANGSYRGMLVEPAATNLLLQSQTISVSPWAQVLAGAGVAPVITATAGTAPDGTNTATRIQLDSGGATINDRSICRQPITIVNATTYTCSIWVRATSAGVVGNTVRITFEGLSSGNTVVHTLTLGWQRITLTGTSNTTVGAFLLETRGTVTGQTADLLAWGAQLETGAVATSYIPTVASTETRTADNVTLTGASSLIGQTQGTIYCEINARNFASSIFRRAFTISDGTTSNMIQITLSDTSSIVTAIVTAGGVNGASIASTALTGILKIAVGYANNDVVLYINGVQIGTDTSVTIPACSKVNIGSRADDTNFLNDHIRAVAIYPTRLANATLATLTTP